MADMKGAREDKDAFGLSISINGSATCGIIESGVYVVL